MKKLILLMVIITCSFFMLNCSSSNDFEKGKLLLEQQGYTDVTNTGYNTFCCSNDDGYSTGFRCLSKNGEVLKGCFCSGLGKGITIRFE